jgi:hypothetical protein
VKVMLVYDLERKVPVNTKRMALIVLKVVVLTLLLFALYSLDFLKLSLAKGLQTAPAIVLLVSFLHTSVLSYPIIRSRWNGWRLIGVMFLLFYGVMYLMTAIEAVYLPEILPPHLVLSLIVNGAITAAAFSIFAVWIYGRMRGDGEEQEPNQRLRMPWTQWVWKLALIAFSYVFLYILFGVLVFLPLAGALDPKALAQASAVSLPNWIIPFQAVRGLMWAVLALPVIRMMRGHWWEAGLAVALSFAVVMSANQLMALDMPAGLRTAHIAELFGENFALGWIVVWLLHRQHGSRR